MEERKVLRCAFLSGRVGGQLKVEKPLKFKHFTAVSGVNKKLNLSLVETSRSLPMIVNYLAVNREWTVSLLLRQ